MFSRSIVWALCYQNSNSLTQNEELTEETLEHLIAVLDPRVTGMDTARFLQEVRSNQDGLPFILSFLFLLFLYISFPCLAVHLAGNMPFKNFTQAYIFLSVSKI